MSGFEFKNLLDAGASFSTFKRVNKFKRFNNEVFVTKNLNEVKTRSKLDCEVYR